MSTTTSSSKPRQALRLCGLCRCPGHTKKKCHIIRVPPKTWYEDTVDPEGCVIDSVAKQIIERRNKAPNTRLLFRETYLRNYARDSNNTIPQAPVGYAPISTPMKLKVMKKIKDLTEPGWREKFGTKNTQTRPRVVNETTCAICLESLTETNKMIGPCGHQFHTNCAMMWGRTNNKCPTCRTHMY